MPPDPLIVLTRAAEDNRDLAGALRARGRETVERPSIAVRLLPPAAPVAPGGLLLTDFRVVAFTSRHGVEGLVAHAGDLRAARLLVACVGRATAGHCRERLGIDPGVVPEVETGAALAAAIAGTVEPPGPVLVVRGDRTAGTLQSGLTAAGFVWHELTVYETLPAKPEGLPEGRRLVAVFASPSAVDAFLDANPGLTGRLAAVAIGPTTAGRLRQRGVKSCTLAAGTDVPALVAAVEAAIEREANDDT